jgi:hypothetical protein
MYIDTPDDFKRWREAYQPIFINSKKGRIHVPCAQTLMVRNELVVANNYNPNHVAKDKMRLLRQSVLDNGFAFPVAAIWDDAEEVFVIVDGYHRSLIGGKDWLETDYLPVAYLEHDINKRMYATVQFNKARGVHQVDVDADLIRSLIEQGQSEEEISVHLGIDLETIQRYKQLTGIAEIFAKSEWSAPWQIQEVENDG